MLSDNQILQSFAYPLSSLGVRNPTIERLAGDASGKQFWRICGDQESRIVLFAAREVTDGICRTNRLLADHGVRVPRIERYEANSGLILLEDLGTWTLAEAMARNLLSPAEAQNAFSQAVDTISTIQRIAQSSAIPVVTTEQYMLELDTLTDWLVPNLTGRSSSTQLVLEFFDAVRQLLPSCKRLAPCLSHRDFYAGNLMLPMRVPEDSIAVIDYEGMSLGSPAYDLVSLLQDLRTEPNDALESHHRSRFIDTMGYSADDFCAEYNAFALLRSLRVFGLWHRLKCRDSKPRYLEFSARTRQHVVRNLDAVGNTSISKLFYRYFDIADHATASNATGRAESFSIAE